MTQPIERSKREPLFLCTEFPSNYLPCTGDCWEPKYIWAKKKEALHANYRPATVSTFLTIKYLITLKYRDFWQLNFTTSHTTQLSTSHWHYQYHYHIQTSHQTSESWWKCQRYGIITCDHQPYHSHWIKSISVIYKETHQWVSAKMGKSKGPQRKIPQVNA